MINADDLLKTHKGFFAFTKEDFEKQMNKNLIPYVKIGMGGYMPKKNYKSFVNDFEAMKQSDIKKEKAVKSDYKIAFDLFMNYELQYSFDGLEDEHITTLKDDYNISPIDTKKYYTRFLDYCIDNDLI
tara:strand:- start:46 stop:429 length:384 start_codon:yes stop_codon:yes gene_type:complete